MNIILRAYVIPQKIVLAVAAGYKKTRAKVLSLMLQHLNVTSVFQGDTLAPFLFILALDYALRQAISGREEELSFTLIPRKSRRIRPVMITDVDFADDIALISNTAEKAVALLSAVKSECANLGLHLSTIKTKVVAFNTRDTSVITKDGSVLEVVDDFKYLGCYVFSTERDLKVRKALI